MKIRKNIKYQIKEFTDEELKLSQSVFGLVPQNVYFDFNVDVDLDFDKNKIVYVYGLSGEGKTIFKDLLKEELFNNDYKILDYDSCENAFFFGRKISEVFDLHVDRDFLISLFSTFGMLEMRNIFSKFEELSAGQQKRIRYMYILYDAFKNRDSKCVILCDELATFLDSLSAKIFMTGLRKFMNKFLSDVIFIGFGCNDNICNYFEDILILMQNGKIAEITNIVEHETV